MLSCPHGKPTDRQKKAENQCVDRFLIKPQSFERNQVKDHESTAV